MNEENISTYAPEQQNTPEQKEEGQVSVIQTFRNRIQIIACFCYVVFAITYKRCFCLCTLRGRRYTDVLVKRWK